MTATTIAWTISNLERTTADGIVYTAHYRVDAENGTYRAGAYGSVSFASPQEGNAVIPFADLTEEIVIGWVKDALNDREEGAVSNVEAALQAQIDEQTAPTTATGTPW